MKECNICGETKSYKEFHKAKDRKDGYRSDCKICRKTKRKKDYSSTTLKCFTCGEIKPKTEEFFHRADTRVGWRRRCKKCHKINQHRRHLSRTYNLSLEDYDKLLNNCNNSCCICGSKHRLVVDHCHVTGEIRGILCDACNRGIGFLREDIDILLSSIIYLEQNDKI